MRYSRAQRIAALAGCRPQSGGGSRVGPHGSVAEAAAVAYVAAVDALVPDADTAALPDAAHNDSRLRMLTSAVACLAVMCANPLNRCRLHRRAMLPQVLSVADSLSPRIARVAGVLATSWDSSLGGGSDAFSLVASRATGALQLLRACLRVLGACTGAEESWAASAVVDPLSHRGGAPRAELRPEAAGSAGALWTSVPSRPPHGEHVEPEALDAAGQQGKDFLLLS